MNEIKNRQADGGGIDLAEILVDFPTDKISNYTKRLSEEVCIYGKQVHERV